MRVEFDEQGRLLHLRLSRRNLESLLHMLDVRDKARPALNSRDNDIEIVVEAEENDDHYADGRTAGQMSWEDMYASANGI